MDASTCLSLVLTLVFVCLILYKLIRPLFPVTVNCWFCGQNGVVGYEHRNSWECLCCKQYNGFTSDGDYNRTIPGMYIEELNDSYMTVKSDSSEPVTNHLCSACNQNQQIKIRQLANFVPRNEDNYDMEVDAYKHHLEQVYRLCQVCEAHVQHRISHQDMLIRQKLHTAGMLKSENTINASTSRLTDSDFRDLTTVHISELSCRHIIDIILQLSIITCALALSAALVELSCARVTHLPLPPTIIEILRGVRHFSGPVGALGMFLQILHIYVAGKDRLKIFDVLTCFSWLLTMLICLWLKEEHFEYFSTYELLLVRCFFAVSALLTSVLSTVNGSCDKVTHAHMAEDHYIVTQLPPMATDPGTVDSSVTSTTDPHEIPFVDGLETMSLGTSSVKPSNTNIGPFGSLLQLPSDLLNNSASTEPSSYSANGLRHRPLILPAKFTGLRPLTVSSADIGGCTNSSVKGRPSRPDIVGCCDSTNRASSSSGNSSCRRFQPTKT